MEIEQQKRGRREAVWEGVVLVLTLVSILLIAWVEFEGLGWSDPLFRTLALVDLGIVVVLAFDFVLRLSRAPARGAFLMSHAWELLGLIPLYAESLSWIRLLRLGRLARLLRLVRVVALSARMKGVADFLYRLLFTHRLGPAVIVSAAIILLMALAVWLVERDVNPSFASFSDALWWAVVTTSTVGYGDITPQTGLARILAGTLMLLGIGMIGMLASTLSATLLQSVDKRFGADVGGADESLASQLERIAALHAAGQLTAEEFTLAKRRVLGASATESER